MNKLKQWIKRLLHTIRKTPQRGMLAIMRLYRRIPLVWKLAVLVLFGFVAVGLLYQVEWSKFNQYTNAKGEIEPAKSLWDWMELLIVPLFLAVGGIAINVTLQRAERSRREQQERIEQARREQQVAIERETREKQAKTEHEIADDRVREQRLQNYLDRMAELLLDYHLSKPGVLSEVKKVARARTLTALRSLDGKRKGAVIRQDVEWYSSFNICDS